MKKSEVIATAEALNDNQAYALKRILEGGEHDRQEAGRTSPLRAKDCKVPWGYRSAVAASTRRSLHTRGLTTGYDWRDTLTPNGLKVAKHLFDLALHDEDGNPIRIESEDAPGILYIPTGVEDYVRYFRNQRARSKQKHADKVKRAARLFRGVKLADKNWSTNSTAVSALIKAECTYEHSSSIKLDLDDLISIGEQIEEMRS